MGYIILSLFLGFILALHLSMNSEVGSIVQNPQMGNALFWIIGAVTAIIIGITNWDPAFFENIKDVPIWLLTAGAMGGALVFGIAWVIPHIGAGPFFVLMIAGQVITGLIFSHFGILGSPVDQINLIKVFGALLVIGGAAIVTFK
ncbi:MAG: DMT family transporter [Balneolaceae bacterium]|nr:DMT family transporter [Balneolaceae bacterium]